MWIPARFFFFSFLILPVAKRSVILVGNVVSNRQTESKPLFCSLAYLRDSNSETSRLEADYRKTEKKNFESSSLFSYLFSSWSLGLFGFLPSFSYTSSELWLVVVVLAERMGVETKKKRRVKKKKERRELAFQLQVGNQTTTGTHARLTTRWVPPTPTEVCSSSNEQQRALLLLLCTVQNHSFASASSTPTTTSLSTCSWLSTRSFADFFTFFSVSLCVPF